MSDTEIGKNLPKLIGETRSTRRSTAWASFAGAKTLVRPKIKTETGKHKLEEKCSDLGAENCKHTTKWEWKPRMKIRDLLHSN
jgi:hypothetical protein